MIDMIDYLSKEYIDESQRKMKSFMLKIDDLNRIAEETGAEYIVFGDPTCANKYIDLHIDDTILFDDGTGMIFIINNEEQLKNELSEYGNDDEAIEQAVQLYKHHWKKCIRIFAEDY